MNCIIGQSGGPTSVINSTLAGVINEAIKNDFDKIYLMENGISGFCEGKILEVDKEKFLNKNISDKLKQRPASILGSCRFKLAEDLNDKIYEKIFDRIKKLNIRSFIYIGGNDSMDTVMKLNKYISKHDIKEVNIIGIPKTIDNDLCEIDHSPGFGSAAKYIISTMNNIRADIDIYNLNSVTIVEIMGRNAGWLAASSLISNINRQKQIVNLLYLKEDKKSKDDIIKEIKEAFKEEKNLLIAVSEGFMDKDGYFEKEKEQSFDGGFNHPQLAGIAEKISNFIHDELSVKTRAIELNIIQRTNTLISEVDSNEAFELGARGLLISMEKTNLIPILKRKESKEYEIYYESVNPGLIANKEKIIPEEWLVTRKKLQEKITEYVSPLIQGEIHQEYENGIIKFVNLDEFIKQGKNNV